MNILFQGTLPYPPSVNHYWHHTGGGKDHRVYIAAKGRAFIEHVKLLVREKKSTKRLAGEFELCAPTNRQMDLDNALKAILDSMQKAGVYLDDGQFDQIAIRRGRIVKGGCVNAVIWEIEE